MKSNTLEIWKHRSRLKAAIRGFFSARSYFEIDTPVLVQTPGTEVYLDYFATTWKDFRKIVGNTLIEEDLEVGTANLYVDVSTSRVGIGIAPYQVKAFGWGKLQGCLRLYCPL